MTGLLDRPGAVLLLVAALCLAAIGVALVSQHVFDMQPCAWCVLQRAVFAGMALLALCGSLWSALRPSRLAQAGALAVTGLLAVAGMASALWQHGVAKISESCKLTLADQIVSGLRLDALAPEVFAPRASCADAAVNLLGLPYEFWSLAMFTLLGIACAWALTRLPRARTRRASG